MKYVLIVIALMMPLVSVQADNKAKPPLFTWDLLWTGSWEESKTLHNRGDLKASLTSIGLTGRGQFLDKRPLNFELDNPWGDPSDGIGGGSFGLYHKTTGSRLLYGTLDEWGLPARIRSPWIRSAPYAENRKPIMADLKTATSSTKTPEAYLYLSSPRLTLFQEDVLPEISVRAFASAQINAEGDLAPAFSGGLETFFGEKADLKLEGFYTGRELPAKNPSTWFSDPGPLPDRDFRLGAASVIFETPFFSVSSDWAWSETFAWGRDVYGNAGLRFSPPVAGLWKSGKAGPWSFSLAADGTGERYVGRDGSTPGAGFRTAGKAERKGLRGSLFRVNTTLRGPGFGENFNRSSTGVYYRFPALDKRSGSTFPLRLSRVSMSVDRNASDTKKINDGIGGTIGLSLNLPVVNLPGFSRRPGAKKPQAAPLGINFTTSVKWLGMAAGAADGAGDGEVPAFPFFGSEQQFESAKTGCELIWSPSIFQFRTRWNYTVFEKKDNLWDMSVSTAVRFKYGRISLKAASPDFPEEWNYTVSWRLEK